MTFCNTVYQNPALCLPQLCNFSAYLRAAVSIARPRHTGCPKLRHIAAEADQ